MKLLKPISLGLCIALSGCAIWNNDDENLGSDREIYQFRTFDHEQIEEIVEAGVIPGHTAGEDVPSAIVCKLDTFWLSNPHYKNDRMIAGEITEKFWGIIPFNYQKCVIRLPKDFPVPDKNGYIGDKLYILYMFDFLNQFSYYRPGHYSANDNATLVFHNQTGIDYTYDEHTFYDLYDDPATQCDKLSTFDMGESRTIEDVGDYLWKKYDLDHHKEKWLSPEYARVFNNRFKLSYNKHGSGYSVYVHIQDSARWYEKILEALGLWTRYDAGIYIDNYAPRYFENDEWNLLLDMCAVADNGRDVGDGCKYDSIYRFSDTFKYDQVKTGDLVYNDMIRWIYCDKNAYGRYRKDVNAYRHKTYKTQDYWSKATCNQGFTYDLTIARNIGQYSDRSDSFDYIVRISNTNTADVADNKIVCGSASFKGYPTWNENSSPSKEFCDKLIEMSYSFIHGENGITNTTCRVTDRLGRFKIYNTEGNVIDECMYGIENCIKTETDYDELYWNTAESASWYNRKYDNCTVAFSKELDESPLDLTGLKSGDKMRIYAIRGQNNDLWIFTMRFDPATDRYYDRYVIYAKGTCKNQFFQEGYDPETECNKISDLVTNCRLDPYYNVSPHSCDTYKQGTVEVNGVLVDQVFTGVEEFNTSSEKSYKLIMTH